MESLQRLASLPLVDNACASRANRDSWTYSVFCREILATGAEDPDARRVSDGVYVKVKEVTTAELLNCGPSSAAITAYSEWRSKFSEGQYMTLLFYHAFMFLEVEGGLAICTEKYNDKLELMFGDLQLVRSYGRCYRATGEQRRPSLQHSHCKVERYVTLRELVDWISGPLAIVWRPYCLINSNCQHYARDVVQFLSDERCAETLRGDREVVLSAVQCEGIRLQYASEKLRDDRSLVLAAVQRDGRALAFASPRLRADRALALAAVAQTGLALQFCDRHQEDEELVMTAVMQNARALQFASAALKRSAAVVRAAGGDWRRVFDCPSLANDEDVALTAISLDWEAAHLISEKLRSDMHFMRRAVGLNGLVLQLAVRLQGCRPAVLAALRQDGLALRFASEELRGDLKVVREAVANNPMALEFASEALCSQRDLVLAAVVRNGHALQFAADELKQDWTLIVTAARRYLFIDWEWLFQEEALRRSRAAALGAVCADALALRQLQEWHADREVVLCAVQQQGMLLELACPKLQADRGVVLAAVRAQGRALRFAAPELRRDPEVLRCAAWRWWSFDWSLLEAPELCSDKEVVLAAVTLDWRALERASEELRDDLEVLQAAVRQSPSALGLASARRLSDRGAMLALLRQNGAALQFVSEGLKGDRDLVLAAVRQNGRALQMASEELQRDREVISSSSTWRGFMLRSVGIGKSRT